MSEKVHGLRNKIQALANRINKSVYSTFRRSLRKRLAALILLIAIGPLSVATAISYYNSKQAMESKVLGQDTAQIEWVQKSLEGNLDRMNKTLAAFFYENLVDFYISKIGTDSNLATLASAYFKDKLGTSLYANIKDVEGIALFIPGKNIAYKSSHSSVTEIIALEDGFFESNMILGSEHDLVVANTENLNFSPYSEPSSGLYLKKYYRNFTDHSIQGILVVQLRWNFLQETMDLLKSGDESRVFLMNADGELIVETDTSTFPADRMKLLLLQMEENKNDITAKKYQIYDGQYVFIEKLADEIYLCKTIPTSVVSASYTKTLDFQIMMILITAGLVILLTFFISSRMTRPILRLASSMQGMGSTIEDISSLKIPEITSNDEIKILEQSYRMMLQRIKELIDSEYLQKIKLQEAYLMALQAQINPHFMYNTLQMIGGMAVENNSPQIYEAITAFSNMMRYNMRSGEDLVTLQDEMNNVGNYLKIQQMRSDGKLDIRTEVDPAVDGYMIPKLSIQPLVENIFKHGFVKTVRKHRIQIRIKELSDCIEIQVEDNGKGISDEKLAEISASLAVPSSLSMKKLENLGLGNIHNRIRLFFGEAYGLSVYSVYGKKTVMTMKIGKVLPAEVQLHD